MGMFRHHVLIVTGSSEERIKQAHEKALEICSPKAIVHRGVFVGGPPEPQDFKHLVSPLAGPFINSQYSFAVWPDGSKEGWGTSDYAEELRNKFIEELQAGEYWVEWVLVEFGGDYGPAVILSDSNEL